jgi:hypothetical protein
MPTKETPAPRLESLERKTKDIVRDIGLAFDHTNQHLTGLRHDLEEVTAEVILLRTRITTLENAR